MMRPPGRSLKVSSEGCAANDAPPSEETDITIVNVPSLLSRCAQIQSRPIESRAISPRRYAVELEVESKTRTGVCGTQSELPFQRHHWKKTSWLVDPPMSGPSYE